MRDLTPAQRRYLANLNSPNLTIHVLSSNVHGCMVLVINANQPEYLRRMFVTCGGKVAADFKYRLVQNPVSKVA